MRENTEKWRDREGKKKERKAVRFMSAGGRGEGREKKRKDEI